MTFSGTTIYVPPCWSVLEYHCPQNDESTTTTIYDLGTFIKKIDDKKSKRILFSQNELSYRSWKSFEGQYSITAKLISIDGVDKTKIGNIDLDKLKDIIIFIEKEENKKIVEVKFNNLSQKDQNYLLEQIKKLGK
ncbi:MAG: hypothetical protein LBC74_10910 [Planctomycetaceae bacterium]|jgi:hypothetical protein|nr:hypothetical protein [Planctomycetaceae bacterium]